MRRISLNLDLIKCRMWSSLYAPNILEVQLFVQMQCSPIVFFLIVFHCQSFRVRFKHNRLTLIVTGVGGNGTYPVPECERVIIVEIVSFSVNRNHWGCAFTGNWIACSWLIRFWRGKSYSINVSLSAFDINDILLQPSYIVYEIIHDIE